MATETGRSDAGTFQRKIAHAVGVLSRSGAAVSGVVLFGMVFYVTADVCGRYFFRTPLRGTLEVSQIMLLVVIFFSITYTQNTKAHVRMELVTQRWSSRVQEVLGIFYSVVAIGIFILMIQYGFKNALTDMQNGVTTDQLKIPIFLAKMIVPVGASLMVMQLLVDMLQHVQRLLTKSR